MKSKSLLLFAIIININSVFYAQDSSKVIRAGLRSSTYGINPFPDTTWWYNVTSDMAARYPGSSPAVIWILGYIVNNGCSLDFPNPTPGTSYSKINFSNKDRSEAYLYAFDQKGMKVWLQVEPGNADVSTLIDLVLTQYGHHPSVIGFGVDVEWYKTSASNNDEGEAVTDEEAEAWVNKIKSYNKDYLLFTKHWLIEKMPPSYRDHIVFVDDSQIFPNMASMVNEFEDWGNAFAPANVAFQYGYESDKVWWEKLSDPPKNIGDEILKKCPNASDLFWVDFTAYDIWPKDFTPTSISDNDIYSADQGFELHQNYPNPFNPSTKISFTIPASLADGIHSENPSKGGTLVTLKVYDILGNEISTLVNEEKMPGSYELTFSAEGGSAYGGDAAYLSSGIYYYQLIIGDFSHSKKMLLIR